MRKTYRSFLAKLMAVTMLFNSGVMPAAPALSVFAAGDGSVMAASPSDAVPETEVIASGSDAEYDEDGFLLDGAVKNDIPEPEEAISGETISQETVSEEEYLEDGMIGTATFSDAMVSEEFTSEGITGEIDRSDVLTASEDELLMQYLDRELMEEKASQ